MNAWRRWLRALLGSTELFLFRRARRRTINGVLVAVSFASPTEADAVFDRIGVAFNLLEFYGQRSLAVLRMDVAGGWIWVASAGRGEWHRDTRLVILDEHYVIDPQTDPREIASTLVHEATHARLHRMGLVTPERSERIERLCFQRQLAFARRLPLGADELIAESESQLARPPGWLTPEVRRSWTLAKLLQLGAPRWFIHVLERASKGD